MIRTMIRLGLTELWVRRRSALVMIWLTAIPLLCTLLLEGYRMGLETTYADADPAFLIVQTNGSLGEIYGSRLPSVLGEELAAGGASLVVPEIRTGIGPSPASAILLRGIPLDTYTQVEDFEMRDGRPLQPGEPPRRAMIGIRLAEKHQLAPGDEFQIRIYTFHVVGVFSVGTYSDHEAWISLQDAQDLLGWGDDVSIFVIPAGETYHAGERLSSGASIVRKGDSSASMLAELTSLFVLLRLVAVTLGVAAALSLSNLLLRLAWRRRRELAILRSLGFGRRALFVYLLAQCSLIVATGFLVGWLGAYIVSEFTSPSPAGLSIRAVFTLQVLFSSLVFAALLTVLGTALPAWQLSRVSLAGLLRNE